jgi:hypothetical protein
MVFRSKAAQLEVFQAKTQPENAVGDAGHSSWCIIPGKGYHNPSEKHKLVSVVLWFTFAPCINGKHPERDLDFSGSRTMLYSQGCPYRACIQRELRRGHRGFSKWNSTSYWSVDPAF